MISAVLIVRNESAQLEACLRSIQPHVDEIVIVDTGSTDSTPEIARRFATLFETFTACNGPDGRIQDFSLARNYALSLATHPWIFWVDGDDEVLGGERLRELAAELDVARQGAPAMVMLEYEYSQTPRMVHWRERFVTPREAFAWEMPVHEVLIPRVAGTMIRQSDAVRVIHHRETKAIQEPGRNLRILRAAYDAGSASPRLLFYFARELGTSGDIGYSVALHRKYLAGATWDDEAIQSCLELARHYETWGDHETSLEYALRSLSIKEGWFESYFVIGRAHYYLARRGGPEERRHWERCAHFLEMALARPETRSVLFLYPLDRSHEIHKYLNVAYNSLGRAQEALDSCRTALTVKPDTNLENNAKIYEAHLARLALETSLQTLGVTAERAQQIRSLLDAPQAQPEKGLDIIVFVGPSWEPWSPVTARENGIGGSETAVIEMTRRWAALGHRVTVYGDCAAMEGIYDGVRYLHHDKFAGSSSDILISSRRPDAMEDGVCDARLKFVWVHDVHLGQLLTHARAIRTDRFLCLSEWHARNLVATHPQIHPEQVMVTRNGIDLELFGFVDDEPRDPHKAIYASSPDRGLDVALKCWPRVRAKIRDAELHVFYGFHNWEGQAAGDTAQLQTIAELKHLLETTPGVIYHGRQSQAALAQHFRSAGVWYYPTWFGETSCITAMQAQAAGLRIVTSPIAALTETVGDRGAMIRGDNKSEIYQTRFVNAVVRAMRRREQSDRAALRAYAREHFSWDDVAEEWLGMFRCLEPGLPPYKSFAAA